MNITYLDEIINNLKEFMSQHDFTLNNNGDFISDDRNFKVDYDDARKEFILLCAEPDTTGDKENYSEISAWYFDFDSHGPNDTKVIADDFIDIISSKLGLSKSDAKTKSQVALPSKAVTGQAPGIEAFTGKFLAMFPQYKDAYKEQVAEYGQFLPVHFYKKYGVEKLRELLVAGNKKAIIKYFTMLEDMFIEGDKPVGNIICSVIIAGTFKGDSAEFEKVAENYLKDLNYIKLSGRASVAEYKRNSKLRAVIEV